MRCKQKWFGYVSLLAVLATASCVLDSHEAAPPVDAAPVPPTPDADPSATPDAAPCIPGSDDDGDSIDNCTEAEDGDPFTHPSLFNGLGATIGERPEGTGNCSALDDYTEMTSRFASPQNQADVYAGWEFDTGADDYGDASYGFMPAWTTSQSGRFSVRFKGRLNLPAGDHCISIDIGATGTGIVNGKNACGQVYIDSSTNAVAETGYGAAGDKDTGCFTVVGDAGVDLDIVFWYFNVLEQAILRVRHCAGAACTPDQPITQSMVQAR